MQKMLFKTDTVITRSENHLSVPASQPPGRKGGKLQTKQQQSVQRRGQCHLYPPQLSPDDELASFLQYEEANVWQNPQMNETRPVVIEKAAAFCEV